MPEFILDHGTVETAKQFRALDSFTQGYIEAMFFTSEGVDNDYEPGHENDLANISVADLAPSALQIIIENCEAFQRDNAALLEQAYGVTGKYEKFPYDESRAGNDYWYTRNGHGTGFWDRGLGDIGEALAKAARYSERSLYRGDDGKLYLA
jgi:hypothetical protein